MPAANKHLDNALENLYRREVMHIAIFTFIDTYRFLFNSITIEEAAQAFLKRFNIDEELYSQNAVISIYYRVNKDLTDLQKHRDKVKALPIKV